MRKTVSLIVAVLLVVATAGAVSAQDLPGAAPEGQNPSNAIGVDTGYLYWGLVTGGFGIGGSYEFAAADSFSVKLGGGFVSSYGGFLRLFDVYGQARYYIWPVTVNGLYVGAGAGVTIASVRTGITGVNDFEDESFTTALPSFNLEVGYKFTLADDGRGGFYLEPNLGVRPTLGGYGALVSPLRFGVGLGWTF